MAHLCRLMHWPYAIHAAGVQQFHLALELLVIDYVHRMRMRKLPSQAVPLSRVLVMIA